MISVRITTTMRIIPPPTEGVIIFRRSNVPSFVVTTSACVKKYTHTHMRTHIHTQFKGLKPEVMK